MQFIEKLKEKAGLILEKIYLKKRILLSSLIVTIFLTMLFVVTAHTDHLFKNTEAFASQKTNFTSVSELIQKAKMLFNSSKFEEAVKWYDQAIKIDSRSIDALNGKGLSLNKLGRYEDAINWFDKAITVNPTSTNSLNNKGITLANLGRYEEAINWFDKAIAVDPNFVDALYNKGGALAELGKYEEALVWTNKALDIDTSNQNTSSSNLILPNQ